MSSALIGCYKPRDNNNETITHCFVKQKPFFNFITTMIVPIGNGRCWFGTFTVLIASVRALFETGVLLGLNLQQ